MQEFEQGAERASVGMLQGYEAPRSLDEAVERISQAPPTTRVLAGGTDLLVQLRDPARRPERVVDLKRIPELRSLRLDGEGLRIGAAVSCAELTEHPEARSRYPGLVEAAELIGSMQIQNRATLGGNFCNGSPAADTTPALLAADARALVVGAQGRREVALRDLLDSPGRTKLTPNEILVELRIPLPPTGSADAYLRFIPRAEMDIAVVGAGVWLQLDPSGRCTAARVALGAVAPTALLVPEAANALVGTALDEAALSSGAQHCEDACRPIDDARGTIRFRKRIARVLFRRATQIAAQRAQRAS